MLQYFLIVETSSSTLKSSISFGKDRSSLAGLKPLYWSPQSRFKQGRSETIYIKRVDATHISILSNWMSVDPVLPICLHGPFVEAILDLTNSKFTRYSAPA